MKRLLILIIPVLLLSGCFKIRPVEFQGIQSVNINSVGKDGVNMTVGMLIDNPNRRKFTITDENLQLYVNDKQIGRLILNDDVVLEKKSAQNYKVDLTAALGLNALSVLPMMYSMAQGNESVELGLKGTIKVKSSGLSKTFPVDVTERIDPENFKMGNKEEAAGISY